MTEKSLTITFIGRMWEKMYNKIQFNIKENLVLLLFTLLIILVASGTVSAVSYENYGIWGTADGQPPTEEPTTTPTTGPWGTADGQPPTEEPTTTPTTGPWGTADGQLPNDESITVAKNKIKNNIKKSTIKPKIISIVSLLPKTYKNSNQSNQTAIPLTTMAYGMLMVVGGVIIPKINK